MTPNNIQLIDIKLQQLKNRQSQLLAKQCDAERKRSTRQAIIIGKWIMTKQAVLATAIPHELELDQDRAAFGLPPKAEKTPQISSNTQVDILLPLDDRPAPPSAEMQNAAPSLQTDAAGQLLIPAGTRQLDMKPIATRRC